jgi:predicted O-methyltransferase YrrM
VRIHVEGSLGEILESELGNHPQVEVYRLKVESVGAAPGTLWRFLALSDRSLDLVLVTDIDEPLASKTLMTDAFERDEDAALGRLGAFHSDRHFLISPANSTAKNYPMILASHVLGRPALVDFDMAKALRGFMAFRRHASRTERPWAYAESDRPNSYNEAIGTHVYGWGSHWSTYCFDERFLKHVVYYHFADRGRLLTFSKSIAPSRMSPEGVWDHEYARARGNSTVDPSIAMKISELPLSREARRTAYLIAEHRWIFDELLALMRRFSKQGTCGCVFFHEIARPEASELIPKQLNLVRTAREASRVLEVGFNAGHSAALMLLANPTIMVRSFDNCELDYTRHCYEFLRSIFGSRLSLVPGPSQSSVPADAIDDYDLVHVDGDHRYEAVRCDLANCLAKCRDRAIVIMDDYEVGNDIARAVAERSELVRTCEFELCSTLAGSSHAAFRFRRNEVLAMPRANP